MRVRVEQAEGPGRRGHGGKGLDPLLLQLGAGDEDVLDGLDGPRLAALAERADGGL